ncbi:MAG: S8 family serine peptidase [Gammaproteobacteria bacterium]
MATIKPRPKTYIISKPTTLPADATDVDFDQLSASIEQLGAQFDALDADGPDTGDRRSTHMVARTKTERAGLDALVVEMTSEVKEQLEQVHGAGIIVEEDEPIFPIDGMPNSYNTMENFALNSDTESLTLRFRTTDAQGQPVASARVTASGMLWVDHGITDANGDVTLTLMGESLDTVSLLEVKPSNSFWSVRVERPAVTAGINNIGLKRIGETANGEGRLDTTQSLGWGQRVMGLTSPEPAQGDVRVAVIDSGLFAAHTDLAPTDGMDFGDPANATTSWAQDQSGHGTHVSGICAATNNTFGIVGFAPNAVLIGLRVFPNASNAKLVAALDWCIDNDIDVINMSLGGKNPSVAVQQRLQACREHGILPIAAAGNSGKAVLFPAAFPETVAVAAIGKLGSFPGDSSHQKHLGETPMVSGDFFVPNFSCRGPEIDLCAPGVAIVSSVPKNGYAAWDGTSMACPHVTGFAARLLQTNTALAQMNRTAERSSKLHEALLARCSKLPGLPAEVQGAGIPTLTAIPTPAVNIDDTLGRLRSLLMSAIELLEADAPV